MCNGNVIYLPVCPCPSGLPEEPTFRQMALERRSERRVKRFLAVTEGIVTALIGAGFVICFLLLFWML